MNYCASRQDGYTKEEKTCRPLKPQGGKKVSKQQPSQELIITELQESIQAATLSSDVKKLPTWLRGSLIVLLAVQLPGLQEHLPPCCSLQSTPQRYLFIGSTRYYTIFCDLIRLSHDIDDTLWLIIGAKFVKKIVRNAWYAWVIDTMVQIECMKCVKVAKNMEIHAKGMSLQMQRVRWS